VALIFCKPVICYLTGMLLTFNTITLGKCGVSGGNSQGFIYGIYEVTETTC